MSLWFLLDDLRVPFDREVFPGETRYNFIDIGFCVVEFHRDFMSELVGVVCQHPRDFLQGSTYPVGRVRSLAPGDHHFDNSFGGKNGL